MAVRIEKKGPVWTVIHDRPEARNAMDPKSADELTPQAAAAIAELSMQPSGAFRIRLHDKRAALVALGKHLGMFADRGVRAGSLTVEIVRFEQSAVSPSPRMLNAGSLDGGVSHRADLAGNLGTGASPVSGVENNVRIVKPDAFIWKDGAIGQGKRLQVDIHEMSFDLSGRHAVVANFDWSAG